MKKRPGCVAFFFGKSENEDRVWKLREIFAPSIQAKQHTEGSQRGKRERAREGVTMGS